MEPMTGSLTGASGAVVGPDSIPVSDSSLRSEPMTGIEPACLAWEASALPLRYLGWWGHCSRRCADPGRRR